METATDMRFTANYTNKVDKKGRVSVPARFRSLLAESEFKGVYVYESFKLPCLEAIPAEVMARLSEQIDEEFGAFEDDKDPLTIAILGAAHDLGFDGEGRILLPKRLMDFAGISEEAVFVGVGEKFLVWEPKAWEAYREEQRARARVAAQRLGAVRRPLSPSAEAAS